MWPTWKHFTRARRLVHLGGREWKLGPFKWHLGGGRYEVGPLSVLRVFQLSEAGGMILPVAGASVSALRLAIPMLVDGPVRAEDAASATEEQLAALAQALAECNDFEYISKGFTGEKEEQATEGPSMPEFIHSIVVISGGAYTHRDVMTMPIQEALEIADSATRLRNMSEGKPWGTEAVSDDERSEIKSLCGSLGFEVN